MHLLVTCSLSGTCAKLIPTYPAYAQALLCPIWLETNLFVHTLLACHLLRQLSVLYTHVLNTAFLHERISKSETSMPAEIEWKEV